MEAFTLGEGFPTIPVKLVEKIQRGEYVDMAALLHDNLLLERKCQSVAGEAVGSGSNSAKTTKKRELLNDPKGLLSWIQCFTTYTAIVTAVHPERLSQLMAYQSLIIREARSFKYKGWLSYDELFREHAAKAKTDWGQLNSMLYSITFLSQQQGDTVSCKKCLGSDHSSDRSALADQASRFKSYDRRERRQSLQGAKQSPYKRSSNKVCYSWNKGGCA